MSLKLIDTVELWVIMRREKWIRVRKQNPPLKVQGNTMRNFKMNEVKAVIYQTRLRYLLMSTSANMLH